jgi:Ca2+:H+ antiporter
MQLVLGSVVGSSMVFLRQMKIKTVQQIGLFVAPLMVIVGWGLSIPMTWEYTIFESCALMFSLIMINLLLSGGKSDYFKGVLLVAVYLVRLRGLLC